MTAYKSIRSTQFILRTADNVQVRIGGDDTDSVAYHEWLDADPANVPDAPDPLPAAPAQITGTQWALALGDLGLADAWETNVAAAKSKYRVRANLLARDTTIVDGDPLIIRLCGTTVPYSAVFAHAQAMPTS